MYFSELVSVWFVLLAVQCCVSQISAIRFTSPASAHAFAQFVSGNTNDQSDAATAAASASASSLSEGGFDSHSQLFGSKFTDFDSTAAIWNNFPQHSLADTELNEKENDNERTRHVDSFDPYQVTDLVAEAVFPDAEGVLAETSSVMVEMRDNRMYVNGELFFIKGVCYSPVPVGESVYWPPGGDYFTPDYAYIWQRDLPLIKAMGANVIRIYGWKNGVDHTQFLDTVHAIGLKVLVTFYLGNSQDNPVAEDWQRKKIIADFAKEVALYADHPAILMWSFGNELNGWWNGFMTQFSQAFNCWWTPYCSGYQDTNSDCQWQSSCVYFQLYQWINSAAKAARIVTTRPIISGIADVDYVVGTNAGLDKVARFDYLLPDIAAWAIQLYRGRSFGGYFEMYKYESKKPIFVTEYGVDAFNDPCGWPENNQGNGCLNLPGEAVGGDVVQQNKPFIGCKEWWLDCAKPGVETQMSWDMGLSSELMNQGPQGGGIVLGGFLMAWTDEFWKGSITQDFCWSPCKVWDIDYCRTSAAANYRPGGAAGCSWKAHFTCGNWDTNFHDLCGYWLAATPDNYVNEEWFGVTTPSPCNNHDVNGGHRLDSLYVRPAYLGMQQLWTGNQEVDTAFTTCDALRPCWKCATTHQMADLNDAICQDVCQVKPTSVGPGSSKAHALGATAPRPTGVHDFLAEFSWPILIGLTVFLCGCIATACVLLRKHESAEESQRLIPIQVQMPALHGSTTGSSTAVSSVAASSALSFR